MTLRVHTAQDIKPTNVRWLSRGRIPLGGITVLAGRQGDAKSTYACHLAAATSRGLTSGQLAGFSSDVVLISVEDDWSATLRPRLEAADANLSRVHFISAGEGEVGSVIELPHDARELAQLVAPYHPRLLVLDPLVALLPGDIDSYRAQDVRRALVPLHQMALDLDMAVVCVSHFNKGTGTDWMTRIEGSGALTAAARSVLIWGPDPDFPQSPRRAMAHAKCNVGGKQDARSYRIEPAVIENGGQRISTSKLIPFGPSNATPESILAVYNNGT